MEEFKYLLQVFNALGKAIEEIQQDLRLKDYESINAREELKKKTAECEDLKKQNEELAFKMAHVQAYIDALGK